MIPKVVLLPGDGIGVEVIDSAKRVLNYVTAKFNVEVKLDERLIGGASFDKFGTPLTDETLQACFDSDVVLLGAVGGHKWENLHHNLKPEAALLKLRKSLGLFANLRPTKVYKQLIDSSSLKKEVIEGTDFVVFRELIGGIYFGEPRGYNKEKGWNTMVYTRFEVERIARMAFETALKRKHEIVSVDKANVLECSQLWREVVNEVSKDYPNVNLKHMYVDNAAMQIVRDPKQFDVILTSNLFGDILSDISGIITGSIGMLPSASIGNKYALYEPIHGSAPDISGKDRANPIAAIASAAMMLEYSFEMNKPAELICSAVKRVIADGYRTQDINDGNCKLIGTKLMTEKIIENIEKIYNEQALGVFTL
jgi:3-isopropylmalate dehydrogenase